MSAPPDLPTSAIVERRRLLELTAPVGTGSLLAVVAPAGFGKSMLLAQWAAEQQRPVAWVQVDRDHNDSVRFWRSVLDAMARAAVPTVERITEEATPGSPRFHDELVEVVHRVGPIGLVLDDAHNLDEPRLGDELHRLLDRTGDGLTVVIGARPSTDALDAMLEQSAATIHIAPDDLRFDLQEVTEALGGADPNRATPGVADEVREQTAGWPIAVVYASRSERSRPGAPRDPSSNDGLEPVELGALRTFLVEEVLGAVPDEVHSFVLGTIHLDDLSPELCDEVTRRDDAAQQLQWLRSQGLLLDPVARPDGWWHYHDLVAELLRTHVERHTDIDVAARHRRAAAWYHERGIGEQTLRHALAADDYGLVGDVVVDVLLGAVQRGEVRTCQQWLRELDPDALTADRAAHDVATMVAAGWLDFDGVARWIESRLRAYHEDEDLLVVLRAGHEAKLYGMAADDLRLNRQALELLDPYFERHPNRPAVKEFLRCMMLVSDITTRLMVLDLDHRAAEIAEIVERIDREMPVLSLWLRGEWSFAAHVHGDPAGARRVMEPVRSQLELMDETSRHLGAWTLVSTLALSETGADSEPAALHRMATELDRMVVTLRAMGWDAGLVPPLMALHAVALWAGDADAADAHLAKLDTTLDALGHAPLLRLARERLRRGSDRASAIPALSERQRSVLEGLAAGRSIREVAEGLDISPTTVRSHVSNIYGRLGVQTRQAAIEWYRIHGEPG